MSGFWVFGYGSLMWRPGFDHLDRQKALLHGFHRALCIYSTHHRGTPQRPGLVLGLDRGGSCRGMAFQVAEAERETVIAYLRERELVSNVYREIWHPVRLEESGVTVEALTYVADRRHAQYAGVLSLDAQVALVQNSAGLSGPNVDYVRNTVSAIEGLGLTDSTLHALAARLGVATDGSTP